MPFQYGEGRHGFVLAESTFGTPVVPAATDAFRLTSFDITPAYDRVEVPEGLDTRSLQETVESLVETAALRCRETPVELAYFFDPTIPHRLLGDPGRIGQIVTNLLNNAVKFTDQGSVDLRANWKDADGGTRLMFDIEDTGPGISPEDQEGLFEAFVQTPSGQQRSDGTGLGLAISQQFAALMDGRIGVESEVGKGSVFHVELAVAPAEADELEAGAARQVIGVAPDQPQYRILIVEDGADNRLLLKRMLEPLSFEVREASNGAEGVEVWRRWRPHLIWMDLRMPVMDGYDATRKIKAEEGGQQTIIVALTASAFEEDRQRVLEIGCDDFVRKPYHETVLFETLARHLDMRYIYAGEPAGESLALTSADLAALPPEMVAQLREAVSIADDSAILQLLREMPDEHASLAKELAQMAREFRFLDLLALLK